MNEAQAKKKAEYEAEKKKGATLPNDRESLLALLATMDRLEYEQRREVIAEKLGIKRLSALDQIRAEQQKLTKGVEDGSFLLDPLPWPEAVDGHALVLAIANRIKRHVVMDEYAALVVALWVVFAWVHDAAVHSPILLITSPEANCGKSTLMGLIVRLVPRGLVIVEVSPAVLYRMIEAWRPTLIVDEADHAFKNNPELRAVINAGWTRGTGVPRCHPETHEPELFETFGPKCIGMKGLFIPDTTLSRSVIIEMQRKLAHEKAEDFAHLDDDGLIELRRQLFRWADDNIESLRNAKPVLPDGFANRLAANWRLMLAIADKVGLGKEARDAAVKLAQRDDDASLGVELLIDIKAVFDDLAKQKIDRIRRDPLVQALINLTDRPWSEMPRTGKPLTAASMRGLLKRFGIKPKTAKFDGSPERGFEKDDFANAWARYVPPPHASPTARNRVTSAEFGQKSRNQEEAPVTQKMAGNS